GQYLRAGAVRGYRDFPLAPVLGLARQRLLRLTARWREWPVGSPARRYALLHAPQHVIDDGSAVPITGDRLALLDALLEGPPDGGYFAAVSAVEAEPDPARRAALEIAVAVLLEDAGAADLAQPIRAHASTARQASVGR